MARCTHCRQIVIYIPIDGSNTFHPVDPDRRFIIRPTLAGDRLIVTDDGEVVRGEAISLHEAAHATEVRSGRESHFSNCVEWQKEHAAKLRVVNGG